MTRKMTMQRCLYRKSLGDCDERVGIRWHADVEHAEREYHWSHGERRHSSPALLFVHRILHPAEILNVLEPARSVHAVDDDDDGLMRDARFRGGRVDRSMCAFESVSFH